jgi:4'-phosphopantetheinyl transferase
MAATLAPHTITIVQADVAAPPVPFATLTRIVTSAERERAARYLHDIDRRRHIIGRGLARLVLGDVLGTDPHTIEFDFTELGKPFLAEGPSFNISHSGDVVLIVLAAEGRLGADVEAVRPLRDLLSLARTSFADDEVDLIRSLPPAQRERPFFRIWARKEAMLKALGCGLTGLSNISVTPEPGVRNALIRLDDPAESIGDWTIVPLACGDACEAAVAWDRRIGELVEW